jgi:hypothetical protein
MRGPPHRIRLMRTIAIGVVAAFAAMLCACATREPASIAPSSATATPTPAPQAAATPEWNLFPDFTTGKIDVYKDGEYVGSITGDEPGDPPMPHKDPRQLEPYP